MGFMTSTRREQDASPRLRHHGDTLPDGPLAPGWLTEDNGSFTHAVCRACGWRGPGRRARVTAANDAAVHQVEHAPLPG